MVTATAVVVREASVRSAGVSGGLQQTAMNIGPALGVAVATTLAPAGASARGTALVVLAAVAVLGALLAAGLPASSEKRRPDPAVGPGARSTAGHP